MKLLVSNTDVSLGSRCLKAIRSYLYLSCPGYSVFRDHGLVILGPIFHMKGAQCQRVSVHIFPEVLVMHLKLLFL